LARFVERLSNTQFVTELDRLVKIATDAAAHGFELTNYKQCCACGCGLLVAPGCKFVNHLHYDRARGLPPAQAERLIKTRSGLRRGVEHRQALDPEA